MSLIERVVDVQRGRPESMRKTRALPLRATGALRKGFEESASSMSLIERFVDVQRGQQETLRRTGALSLRTPGALALRATGALLRKR